MANFDNLDSRTSKYSVLRGVNSACLMNTFTLADDATVTLGTLVAAQSDGVYLVWTNAEVALYQISGTTVTLGPSITAADFNTADVDGDVCLYNSSGSLVLKNRLGATKTIRIARLA